jgi:hypothetical protein
MGADATPMPDPHVQPDVGDGERLEQAVAQSVGDLGRIGQRSVGEEDGELVAAQSHQQVARPQATPRRGPIWRSSASRRGGPTCR